MGQRDVATDPLAFFSWVNKLYRLVETRGEGKSETSICDKVWLVWVFVTLLELVPVELASVILQTVDGSQTELIINGGENLNPVLNPTACVNVVLKVSLQPVFRDL